MARIAFIFLCLFSLPGCALMTVAGANMITIIHDGKALHDYAVSAEYGEDCSLLHASRGESYCQPYPPDPRETLAELADTRYCYRTLGRIDCYERPDFLASGHTRVDFAAGYLERPDLPDPVALRGGPGSAMAGIPAPPASAALDTPPAHLAQVPPLAALPGQGSY